jgi:hypothetical protein
MVLLADRIVERSKHLPKVVVLSPSPCMWATPTIVPSDIYFQTQIELRDLPSLVLSASTFEEASADIALSLFKLQAQRTHMMAIIREPRAPGSTEATGSHGWVSLGGRVDADTQNSRAKGRAGGYYPSMHTNHGKASYTADRYLRYSITKLQKAGIRVAIMGSPQASQLDANYDADSIYQDYIAHLQAISKDLDAPFLNANDCPVVTDGDYTDGDHLSEPGAKKLSAYVAHNVVVPLFGYQKIEERQECRVVFDFDAEKLPEWELAGTAFGGGTCPGTVGDPSGLASGYLGPRFLSSRNQLVGDAAEGVATSPPFALDGSMLRFRVNGGAGAGLEVALQVDGADRFVTGGPNNEAMKVTEWDLSSVRGQTGRLVVRDRNKRGHIGIDDVRVCP